jgi:hypothetical protein
MDNTFITGVSIFSTAVNQVKDAVAKNQPAQLILLNQILFLQITKGAVPPSNMIMEKYTAISVLQ